ncbi:hypothetical protein MRX96_053152, partial [Rhipicephalus microplus]
MPGYVSMKIKSNLNIYGVFLFQDVLKAFGCHDSDQADLLCFWWLVCGQAPCWEVAIPVQRWWGGWTEQNPQGSPKYLKLAHYAVSTQTEGETVYNTVLNLTNVATQVVAGVNYNLTFTTAPTNCRVGQVQYSATQCPPAGP